MPPASPLPMSPQPKVIYSIGDSISVQYGAFLSEALGEGFEVLRRSGDRQAAQNLNVPKGSNSGDSHRVLEFLESQLAGGTFHPGLVILNCGLHDIKRVGAEEGPRVPLAEYRANLEKIAALLDRREIPVAWINTTHCNDVMHNEWHSLGFTRRDADVQAYNRAAEAVMTAARIPIIDLNGYTRHLGPDETLFMDHIHFREEVRRKQAEFLAAWIRSYFTRPASAPTTQSRHDGSGCHRRGSP